MPVSVNKPPVVLAAWQALYRHSKISTLIFTHNGQWAIIIIVNASFQFGDTVAIAARQPINTRPTLVLAIWQAVLLNNHVISDISN